MKKGTIFHCTQPETVRGMLPLGIELVFMGRDDGDIRYRLEETEKGAFLALAATDLSDHMLAMLNAQASILNRNRG